jgi:hypothetical protein
MARMHRLAAGVERYLQGTMFWHLGFWEWVGSGVVFLFFAVGVGMLGKCGIAECQRVQVQVKE